MYCSKCGKEIDSNANVCPSCGTKVASTMSGNPTIINIENTNTNTNVNPKAMRKEKSKWVALLLWFFFGIIGGHKFYEGKVGMGILYLFTGGLFGIGLIIDFFSLLFKSNPYYV